MPIAENCLDFHLHFWTDHSNVRGTVVEQIVKAVSDEFANSNKSQRLRALQRVQDIPEETMKILSNAKYKK
ncbi:hypothetical protein AB9F42_32055 [Rhizobium leguminosarum]|uniref:hypothetical protein n=1 Tax=Rhizobium leguminosarum TaxID=384 RepID=UPI001C94ADCE|nr:hypothetical protein [Rhizobium leguminosarum]MBY5393449.1 hypothetical protein [Rhizobium leguminosarum]